MVNEKIIIFGKIISQGRKKKGYTLGQCAALIIKEDNSHISIPYLSDLENGRRTPSEHIVKQLATVLDIPVEYLYVYTEIFPKGVCIKATEDEIVRAFKTFIKSIS